jgi:hypothetical protein
MTKRYKPGRYDADSVYCRTVRHRHNKEQKIHSTGPVHEGTHAPAYRRKWDNDLIDILFEEFLAGKHYTSARDDLKTKTGRSPEGVMTKIRKVSIRYKSRTEHHEYKPQDRRDRTLKPMTDRDLYIVKLATGLKGRKHGAHHISWIARLLGRSEKQLQKYLLNRVAAFQTNRTGFGFDKPNHPKGDPELILAKAIFNTVKHVKF